jgi:prepilin-type N-terminal cleavage/methylation domain-containing protein
MKYFMKSRGGFTLIELLIVIGLIAILAGVVFVALDPLTRFADARDGRRNADTAAFVSAIRVDQVDRDGFYVPAIAAITANDTNTYLIGSDSGCDTFLPADCNGNTITACVDLVDLQTGGYLGIIPVAPQAPFAWDQGKTGYYLRKRVNNSIQVGACEPENVPLIEVTR